MSADGSLTSAHATTVAPFDALYRASPDPWGTQSRWYERRKRTLLLAALPHESYESVYEAGCGTGHISAALATRCTRLLASDASAVAVDLAARALAGHANVTVAQHRLPEDWPRERFDLVVLSEVLYFIDRDERVRVAAAARQSIGETGIVIACNWRHVIDGRSITGDQAHRHFETVLRLPRLLEYEDDDFVLTAWGADTRSTALREGLR
jgi:SAM-dependent methyltransferase